MLGYLHYYKLSQRLIVPLFAFRNFLHAGNLFKALLPIMLLQSMVHNHCRASILFTLQQTLHFNIHGVEYSVNFAT